MKMKNSYINNSLKILSIILLTILSIIPNRLGDVLILTHRKTFTPTMIKMNCMRTHQMTRLELRMS